MSTVRLYLKNEAFETVDVIQQGADGLNYSSLEWESIFHQQDKFSMQCGVTNPDHVSRILERSTVYIVRNDTFQIAYINRKEFDGKSLTLEGIGVEGLLAKRFTTEADYVPNLAEPYTNNVGVVMCDIINANHPFPWLVADREANRTGVSIATFTEVTGNVYKYLKMLSAAYDVGFKCLYDESTDTVNFITSEPVGYDVDIPGRTYRLADELGNAKELAYEFDLSKYYNYARVIGQDLTVIVDQSGDEEQYEYSFKSRARRGSLGLEQYESILRNEGVQELAKRRIQETFTIQPTATEWVELGWETISTSKNIRVATKNFCTEVKETWESIYSREYTFGYRTDEISGLVIALQGEFTNA